MTELTKILGKTYEKLKKIFRKTYDHIFCLSYLLRYYFNDVHLHE